MKKLPKGVRAMLENAMDTLVYLGGSVNGTREYIRGALDALEACGKMDAEGYEEVYEEYEKQLDALEKRR